MKKRFTALLIAALFLGLSSCGGRPANSGQSSASHPQPNSSHSAPTASSESSAETNDTVQDGKILIAYFSWSGNTEQLAGLIQEKTGGDLFAIEPVTPYTDNYNDLLDIATQEQNDQARPAVAGEVENWEDYSTIFIGYPNWWSDTPMIVRTFLESYDCAGKMVIPFCTHGGGGFGRSVDSIKESAAGAEVLDGFEIAGSRVGSADISSWIDGLGLN